MLEPRGFKKNIGKNKILLSIHDCYEVFPSLRQFHVKQWDEQSHVIGDWYFIRLKVIILLKGKYMQFR